MSSAFFLTDPALFTFLRLTTQKIEQFTTLSKEG